MPRKTAKAAPLYQRGPYRLVQRTGRTNLEIVWYDAAARRERSRSAGTCEVGRAKDALDALYLQRERGEAVCPTCNRPWEDQRRFLLVQAMLDYDTARQGRPSYPAISASLAQVHAYLKATDQTGTHCEAIDPDWIDAFTEWALEVPVVTPAGKEKPRAPATVNNCVLYLAAAINFSHRRKDTLFPAAFRARKPGEVNRTPTFRVDVDGLAAMFDYALQHPEKRRNLLNFLRISVVSLVRPEHAPLVDMRPDAGMWSPEARALNLLPRGVQQTKKRRPIVPVARQAVPWLESESGQIISASSVKSAWTTMRDELGLPGEGQAGMKLLRRSMATLVNTRIDRRDRPELEMFLGHRIGDAVTDLYAPFDPAYLSRARAAIEGIIDDIEARVPHAFTANAPQTARKIVSINAGKV